MALEWQQTARYCICKGGVTTLVANSIPGKPLAIHLESGTGFPSTAPLFKHVGISSGLAAGVTCAGCQASNSAFDFSELHRQTSKHALFSIPSTDEADLVNLIGKKSSLFQ